MCVVCSVAALAFRCSLLCDVWCQLFVVCLCGCLSCVAGCLTLFGVRCRVLSVIVAGVCWSPSVLLPVVLLFVVVVGNLLFVGGVVYCLLIAACRVLFVVLCRALIVVWCLLMVVCYVDVVCCLPLLAAG